MLNDASSMSYLHQHRHHPHARGMWKTSRQVENVTEQKYRDRGLPRNLNYQRRMSSTYFVHGWVEDYYVHKSIFELIALAWIGFLSMDACRRGASVEMMIQNDRMWSAMGMPSMLA